MSYTGLVMDVCDLLAKCAHNRLLTLVAATQRKQWALEQAALRDRP